MARDIYLLIFPQPRTAAHWAIFVPQLGSTDFGKVIHVVGTPFTGFGREFKRNYNLAETNRGFQKIKLAEVADEHIVDVPGNGDMSSDVTPSDSLERQALRIDPPGVSRTPLDPSAENCQTWLRTYVDWLVKKGLVGQAALDILANARTH